eukprot:jgi/Tetstr1/436189/TSEL_025034.t1
MGNSTGQIESPNPGGDRSEWVPFGKRYPTLAGVIASAASVSPAAALTNPFDVVKVRQQMMPSSCAASHHIVRAARQIVSEEGPRVLWNGAPAAAFGGFCYGAMRIGMYQPIKEMLPSTREPLVQQIAAGMMCGAGAVLIFNPLELIKTQLQLQPTGASSPLQVVREIVQKCGFVGLWRGTAPSAMRASILTASQCATYDSVKRRIIRATGWKDDIGAQFATSMVTGVVTTTATAPIDLVKSKIYIGGKASGGVRNVVREVMLKEGPAAFFKGWTAQYLRLGPQTMITFLLMERLRLVMGLGTF